MSTFWLRVSQMTCCQETFFYIFLNFFLAIKRNDYVSYPPLPFTITIPSPIIFIITTKTCFLKRGPISLHQNLCHLLSPSPLIVFIITTKTCFPVRGPISLHHHDFCNHQNLKPPPCSQLSTGIDFTCQQAVLDLFEWQ